MEKKSVEELEAEFTEKIQKPPYPYADMLVLIESAPASKGDEWTVHLLAAYAEEGNFADALKLVSDRLTSLDAKLRGTGVRDALKRTTKDRLVLSYLDAVGFGVRPLVDAVKRLKRLISFEPGARVLSEAWGVGEVRRIDAFYRRITVDFRVRKGHQFTYDAACETLRLAPEKHILVTAAADPDRIAALVRDQPAEFVKEMLASFGDMPVARLEELSSRNGFVKAANWKNFWEKARAALRTDGCVDIPARRSDSLHVKASAESYGEAWFAAFARNSDPKAILADVRAYEQHFRKTAGKDAALEPAVAETLAERLSLALTGARGNDDALYARIAFCLSDLSLATERVDEARAYLKEYDRYLTAAHTLPAREMDRLVTFLVNGEDAAKAALYAKLSEMCFPLLTATLDAYAQKDPACEAAAKALLRRADVPPTLVVYVLGRLTDDLKALKADGKAKSPALDLWTKDVAFLLILEHAIALGEGRRNAEALKMQNIVRRFFADRAWIECVFARLEPADRAIFFERFQASIAWDPSTHHTIVVRMTNIDPSLKDLLVHKAEVKTLERITSMRSYAERKAAYQKLITIDIPANTKRIEFARSYGDLSENAEYQYAKDEERALQKKQSDMQAELNAVKPTDFANVEPDAVKPGTTVVIRNAAGQELAYTVLGEWDNDLEKGIIADKTPLAQQMLGKQPGDTFDLSDAEGNVAQAVIVSIGALSEAVKEWIRIPAGLAV